MNMLKLNGAVNEASVCAVNLLGVYRFTDSVYTDPGPKFSTHKKTSSLCCTNTENWAYRELGEAILKTLMQEWLFFFWKPCQSHIRRLLHACIHVWRGSLTWSLYESTTLSNHPVRPAVWQTVYTQLAVRLNMLSVYLWETATAASSESCLWNTALDAKTMGVNVAGDTTAEPLELLQKSQLS